MCGTRQAELELKHSNLFFPTKPESEVLHKSEELLRSTDNNQCWDFYEELELRIWLLPPILKYINLGSSSKNQSWFRSDSYSLKLAVLTPQSVY